mgnify:CR=1 FL=1
MPPRLWQHQAQSEQPWTRDVAGAQGAVSSLLGELYRAAPWINGHLVEDVALGVGVLDVPHGLGRKLRGWMVVRDDSKQLRLAAEKSGDFALSNFNAWNDITGWSATSADASFNTTTGVWTCPHTGLYRLDLHCIVSSVADGTYAGARILEVAGNVSAHHVVLVRGPSVARLPLSWPVLVTAGQTFKPQAYRNVGSLSVLASNDTAKTRFMVQSDDTITEDRAGNPDETKYLRLYSARERTVSLVVF